ncbi:hypothetical protein CsatA_025120 [Cannabis sativa]
MGCGESKHDVATGNTILQRKKSDNSIKTTSINAKDIETVHENPPINATVDQVKGDISEDQAKEEEKKENNLLRDDEKNKKEKLDVDDDGGGGVQVVGREVGRDSPNRFFSSRKDEELGIDMIISDGQSGKSEYNTPRHGAGEAAHELINKDHNNDDANNTNNNDQDLKVLKENDDNGNKESLPHVQQVTQAVDDDEKENEKPVSVEENSVKEVETIKVEEKDLKLVEEVKSTNQNAEEVSVWLVDQKGIDQDNMKRTILFGMFSTEFER